jgi:hypothetical protein
MIDFHSTRVFSLKKADDCVNFAAGMIINCRTCCDSLCRGKQTPGDQFYDCLQGSESCDTTSHVWALPYSHISWLKMEVTFWIALIWIQFVLLSLHVLFLILHLYVFDFSPAVVGGFPSDGNFNYQCQIFKTILHFFTEWCCCCKQYYTSMSYLYCMYFFLIYYAHNYLV